jgi:3-oxoadipate enol-lactonase
MPSIDLTNGELYYESKGSGMPLLLLHAGIADSRMWDEQIQFFAGDFHVVRCDLRGYGNSQLPDGQFAYHDDILALAQALDLPPAWIVGASFGGLVAVDFCLSYPERVRGLVLASPAISGMPRSDELTEISATEDELEDAGKFDELVELNLHTWVDGLNRATPVNNGLRKKIADMQLVALQQPVPENVSLERLDPPAYQRLQEIHVPVLALSGALDLPDFIEITRTLEEQVPGAMRIIFPDTAHMISMEAAGHFNQIVMEFIKQNTAR